MHKKVQTLASASTGSAGLWARMSDGASFWAIILLSAAAVAVIALVTPFVVVVTALAGLAADRKPHSSWRPSRA